MRSRRRCEASQFTSRVPSAPEPPSPWKRRTPRRLSSTESARSERAFGIDVLHFGAEDVSHDVDIVEGTVVDDVDVARAEHHRAHAACGDLKDAADLASLYSTRELAHCRVEALDVARHEQLAPHRRPRRTSPIDGLRRAWAPEASSTSTAQPDAIAAVATASCIRAGTATTTASRGCSRSIVS